MSGSITLENRFGVNKMELISLKYAIFVIALLTILLLSEEIPLVCASGGKHGILCDYM